MEEENLLFPIDWLICPIETSEEVFKKQRSCIEGDILSKCPILCKVAFSNVQNGTLN